MKARGFARPGLLLYRTFPAALFLIMLFFGRPLHAAEGSAPPTAVRQRFALEQAARENPFLLLPHKPNYILPLAYCTDPNEDPLGLESGELDKMEMKFQVSLKVQVSDGWLGSEGDLYAAYTNRSWWQAYNAERSRPFRETNHEPELFLLFDIDHEILGFKATNVVLGAAHESNGQGGSLSRSWNRIYGVLILQKDGLILSLKPWYRIPEREKSSPDDAGGDDNPDILHYMGPGEIGLFYKMARHSLSMMVRNNFRSDNKGALELGWRYPLSPKLKGYIQLFDGYGENLIDYDYHITRIGAGFLLADWL